MTQFRRDLRCAGRGRRRPTERPGGMKRLLAVCGARRDQAVLGYARSAALALSERTIFDRGHLSVSFIRGPLRAGLLQWRETGRLGSVGGCLGGSHPGVGATDV